MTVKQVLPLRSKKSTTWAVQVPNMHICCKTRKVMRRKRGQGGADDGLMFYYIL